MPAYSQKDPIISNRLRSNPYPAIAIAVDPAYARKCSSSPGRPVRAMSSAGSSDRSANRATQHQVRKRSDVLRRPARICTGIAILAYFASLHPAGPLVLLLRRRVGAAAQSEVYDRGALGVGISRRPMQSRSNPRRWLIIAHLEYAAGGLDLGPRAPPRDERARVLRGGRR